MQKLSMIIALICIAPTAFASEECKQQCLANFDSCLATAAGSHMGIDVCSESLDFCQKRCKAANVENVMDFVPTQEK